MSAAATPFKTQEKNNLPNVVQDKNRVFLIGHKICNIILSGLKNKTLFAKKTHLLI
jgi:hypothetical protein